MENFIPPTKLTTPVLFIVFNRPHTTKLVFEAIRKAKPEKLYIAADGPREKVFQDIEKCQNVRDIFKTIDWECEVKTLYNETNLNCGKAPSLAMNWFFEQEEQGIILEDDCLPSQSFFWYCQELLARYKDDKRIMHIGGNNFLGSERINNPHDYYFSMNGHIWGWATWRRAWQYYDYNISNYKKLKSKQYFKNFFVNNIERIYRLRKFDQTIAKRGNADWWDYQWDFARFTQNGLSIVPTRNLVKNIGFGDAATHTKNNNSANSNLGVYELKFPLKHPKVVIRDVHSDKIYFKKFMSNSISEKIQNLVMF